MRPGHLRRVLTRGLRQRCPLCGEGRLFRGWFRMHRDCPVCGLRFERERGYFVGGMELHWISTYVLGIALYFIADPLLPPGPLGILTVYMPFVLGMSALLYRPARSCWMALDNLFDPVEREYSAPPGAFEDEPVAARNDP